jgi:hypothetical protein
LKSFPWPHAIGPKKMQTMTVNQVSFPDFLGSFEM